MCFHGANAELQLGDAKKNPAAMFNVGTKKLKDRFGAHVHGTPVARRSVRKKPHHVVVKRVAFATSRVR